MSQTVVVSTPSTTVVTVERARTVVVGREQPRTAVVVRGVPGPEGKQGPAGPAGGATLVKTAVPISGHAAVALDATGQLIYADCTNAAHLGAVLGVTENAYAQGVDAEVKTSFTLTHAGWSFTPGPVLVGAGGALVQALPAGAVFTQVIGTALSATVLHIDPQPPILLS